LCKVICFTLIDIFLLDFDIFIYALPGYINKTQRFPARHRRVIYIFFSNIHHFPTKFMGCNKSRQSYSEYPFFNVKRFVLHLFNNFARVFL